VNYVRKSGTVPHEQIKLKWCAGPYVIDKIHIQNRKRSKAIESNGWLAAGQPQIIPVLLPPLSHHPMMFLPPFSHLHVA